MCLLNLITWHHSFRFRFNFQILKLDLRFQINSNILSGDRSFGHKSTEAKKFFQQTLAKPLEALYLASKPYGNLLWIRI